MGFLKKIFKGVKKAFKSVGKLIKKTFKGFGKFMNKLGIFGQIGMMFIAPGLANMAMKGLTTLGSGFMTGLSAAANAGSGLAKVSHAILTTAANAAKTGMGAVRTISDTVQGVVLDTAKGVLNKVPVLNKAISPMPVIDPSTGLKTLTKAGEVVPGNVGDIFKNAANRFQSGANKTWASFQDTAKTVGDIMPGGPEYSPNVQEYIVPEDEGLFGGRKGDIVSKEINYNTKNREAYLKSQDMDLTEIKAADVTGGSTQPEPLLSKMGKDFREGVPDLETVGAQALTRAATEAAYKYDTAKPVDLSLGLMAYQSDPNIALETQARGSGVPLAETGTDASRLAMPQFSTDAMDYNSMFSDDAFFTSMDYTNSTYNQMMKTGNTFAGSYA